MKENNLRPFTILHKDAIEAFCDVNQSDPNCVLMGDAADNFTYQKLNEAFQVLLKTPMLLVMGYGLVGIMFRVNTRSAICLKANKALIKSSYLVFF